MNPKTLPLALATALLVTSTIPDVLAEPGRLLNAPVDVAPDFRKLENTLFTADKTARFDAATGQGSLIWQRNTWRTKQAFNNTLISPESTAGNEFPGIEYAANPELPFAIEFVSPRCFRLKLTSGPVFRQSESLMLAGPVPKDASWKHEAIPGGHRYTSAHGSVTLTLDPWHIEIRDATGKLLTRTQHLKDQNSFTPLQPFSFVRRAADYSRSMSAVFSLNPGEHIYGGGESFTALDKRGQKLVLWTDDANGVQNQGMYKPIPFFMSSEGYGMFIHTTTPVTCDFGHEFNSLNSLSVGDDELDLFVFLGNPREILDAYTGLTGKPSVPPLWTFGLWMSRCTYMAEDEVRQIAARLRKESIPCDVLHLDTGWFETDWRCDYQFSKSRFKNPKGMIADLKNDGFRVCLWQLPYFVPKNELFPEIVSKGLAVRDAKGNLPAEDAILDFSNPNTISWYREKIGNLLDLGVSAIKVDFGEAAPLEGLYASGRTGFYEHNYYPLRYNKVVADLTKEKTGDAFIWARSTWAGSQRYPLHWGGDAESTDAGMNAQLRGGLSLGLSGFSFWSHDAGGFVGKESPDLYLRWFAMAALTSHTRCHGMSPKEPWTHGEEFTAKFRSIAELRYKLLPYLYAQAADSASHGIPMLRPLLLDFPNDPGVWSLDDQYQLGSDLLVAPLMKSGESSRAVYLPGGSWTDYQTGKSYPAGWHRIEAGPLPILIFARNGSLIPHIALAQTTAKLDWSKIQLAAYGDASTASGLIHLPGSGKAMPLHANQSADGTWKLDQDPSQGKTSFDIRSGH